MNAYCMVMDIFDFYTQEEGCVVSSAIDKYIYVIVKERFDEIDMRRQALQRDRKAILDSIARSELEKTRSFI